MKKVLIVMLCLFSFMEIGLAKNKYNSKIYVKYNNKVTKKIDVKDKKEITLDVYFEAKDFDMYAIVYDLDYNKKALELTKAEAYNNFEVTSDKKVLADRIEIPEDDDHKVLSLTFKVKKDKCGKISFKNIQVANIKEQFDLDDIKIKISGKSNAPIIIAAACGILLLGGAALLIIKKKTKK